MADVDWDELSSLDEEEIPDKPPTPPLQAWEPADSDDLTKVSSESQGAAFLNRELWSSAITLYQVCRARQGKYQEGKEVPESCRAVAMGAITVGYASLEAQLNEVPLLIRRSEENLGVGPKVDLPDYVDESDKKLVGLIPSLPLKKQLVQLAGVRGETVNWGEDPYQSLILLMSVRKHLLHHEGEPYRIEEGFWPAGKLREVVERRINTPYPVEETATPPFDKVPLHWHQHVFTPNGVRWALDVLLDIRNEVDRLVGVYRGGEKVE